MKFVWYALGIVYCATSLFGQNEPDQFASLDDAEQQLARAGQSLLDEHNQADERKPLLPPPPPPPPERVFGPQNLNNGMTNEQALRHALAQSMGNTPPLPANLPPLPSPVPPWPTNLPPPKPSNDDTGELDRLMDELRVVGSSPKQPTLRHSQGVSNIAKDARERFAQEEEEEELLPPQERLRRALMGHTRQHEKERHAKTTTKAVTPPPPPARKTSHRARRIRRQKPHEEKKRQAGFRAQRANFVQKLILDAMRNDPTSQQ